MSIRIIKNIYTHREGIVCFYANTRKMDKLVDHAVNDIEFV